MDEKVRQFGVISLKDVNNQELSLIMLQLVQALKFEPYHNSALARFIIFRALFDCRVVGTSFFWVVQSELKNGVMLDRYTLMIEAFLRRCGPSYRGEFMAQMDLVNKLKQFAKTIQQTPSLKRNDSIRKLLSSYLFSSVILPSNPEFDSHFLTTHLLIFLSYLLI